MSRLILAILILAATRANGVDPLAHWHLRYPHADLYSIRDLAMGDGRYVAVGDAGVLAVSEDLVHWRPRNLPAATRLNAVAYGSGTFVAVGAGGLVLRSSNGEEWSSLTLGTNIFIRDICFGPGRFVAVGSGETPASDAIWTSTNGLAWERTFRGSNGLARLEAVTYGGDRFVAVGLSSMMSLDGTNWVAGLTGLPLIARDVAYGNGNFVAIPLDRLHGMTIRVSQDGLNWRASPFLESSGSRIAFGHDLFVSEGFTTIDGSEMTPRTNNLYGALSFDGTRFVTVSSGRVSQSSDGVHWFDLTDQVSLSQAVLVSDGQTSLLLGGNPYDPAYDPSLLWTTNGLSWTSIVSSISNSSSFPIYDAIFAAGKFVGLGWDGSVLLSSNGIDWWPSFSDPAEAPRTLSFARGLFYGRSNDGRMRLSSDAITWSPAEFDVSFSDLADDGTLLAAVDGSTNIVTSSNGVLWVTNPFASPKPLTAIAHGNGVFVAIGLNGVIARSTNAIDWSLGASGSSVQLHAVAFGNNVFVVAGSDGAILTSTDGRAWTARDSGTRQNLRNVISTADYFLISGDRGIILQSDPFFQAPPSIIRGPDSQTVHNGTELSMDVIASGSSPLSFQWSINGVTLEAATNSYLYQRFASPSDAGRYSIVITNTFGSVTSQVAAVSIETNISPPQLTLTRRSYAEVDVLGTPGAQVAVEFTSDLSDSNSWQILRTVVPTIGAFTLSDARSTNVPARFYRAVIR